MTMEDDAIMNDKTLIEFAKEARAFAYTPYSNFKVGAALLAKNGTVFKGCNIENSAFSPTNCAERTAFFKAVSEGIMDFEAIAIVGAKEGEEPSFCAPCGVCRQVMAEFCDPETFRVILIGKEKDETISFLLKELLPAGFKL